MKTIKLRKIIPMPGPQIEVPYETKVDPCAMHRLTKINHLVMNREVKGDHLEIHQESKGDPLEIKLGSKELYSSSNIITTNQSDPYLMAGWDHIDITPLENINLSTTFLKQLQQQGQLTPTEVQDSIYAFAFDLQENNKGEKIKGNPLSYFMGILQKGIPYAPPANYLSPRDKALQEYIIYKKLAEVRRQKVEAEAQELAYIEWAKGLSEEQIEAIIPENKFREEPYRVELLKKHFKEHIWKDVLMNIMI